MKPIAGLLILSISLIICAFIIANRMNHLKVTTSWNDCNREIALRGAAGGNHIPVELSSTSNDVTYKTTLTIGEKEKLIVVMYNGEKDIITGDSIVAEYYHVSHLLTVQFNKKGKAYFRNYNSAAKWYNEK